MTSKYFAININFYLFSCGGVIGTCKGGRIRCSNTFTDRLNNISDKALPDIRNILFGISQSRKFTN